MVWHTAVSIDRGAPQGVGEVIDGIVMICSSVVWCVLPGPVAR